MMRYRFFAYLCAVVTAVAGTTNAYAQIDAPAAPFPVMSVGLNSVRGNGIAFDPKNKIYLAVATRGVLRGQFFTQDGAPAGTPFMIPEGAAYTHFPSVAYSPDAD